MKLEPSDALPILMERLSAVLDGSRQPFSRSKAECLVANPTRGRIALDALIVGGYVAEDQRGRLRLRSKFVRAKFVRAQRDRVTTIAPARSTESRRSS